jgi:hypothetical protein
MKTHKRSSAGIPIVDAKNALRVFINADDIKTAVRKDPAHCAFSNACRRLFGSHSVVFFRTLAYVELPSGKRGRRIERFTLTDETRRLIVAFDRRGKISEDGYALLPPSKSMTLEGRMEKDRTYRESGGKRAAEEKRAGRPVKKEPAGIRSGKGIVQFITREKNSIRQLLAAT